MKNKGFSLVELIVVIAIMAILVGVAVPVYSSYIEKTEIAKDKQLVDEVAHAIQIGQASGQNFGAAYIILNSDGAPAISSTNLETYLKTVFGEDLEGLELSYDGWKINGSALNSALSLNAEIAASVGKSSYLNNSNVPELLDNVQVVTSAAAGLLGSVAKDADGYIAALQMALGNNYLQAAVDAGIIDKSGEKYLLKSGTYSEVTGEDGKKTVVLSQDLQNQLANLMVLTVADELKDIDSQTVREDTGVSDMQGMMLGVPVEGTSTAAQLASQYALFKAYAMDTGNTEDFDQMNVALQTAGSLEEVQNAFKDFTDVHGGKIYEYAGTNQTQFAHNANTIPAIMNGVSSVSGTYANAEALKSADLFTNGGAANDLNAFVGAAALNDTITGDQKSVLQNLTDGVVIFVNADGSCTIVPTV